MSNIVTVSPMLGIVVSVYMYFRKKRNEKERTARNLYHELKDALEGLDYKKFPSSFRHIDITDDSATKKTVYFMARLLNHDFYDSLVYSGKINFLEPDLQQRVQDIFNRIKDHNKCLRIASEMSYEDRDVVPKIHKYYEWLDANERHLNEDIPKMVELLRNHM